MTSAQSDRRGNRKLADFLCALLLGAMGAAVYSACTSSIDGDDKSKEGGESEEEMGGGTSSPKTGGAGGSPGGKVDAGLGGMGNTSNDAAPGPAGACKTPPPIKIIFDTDIGPDCDDAGAVAMLHTLADRCEIEIIGMMSATSYEFGAAALDAINTFYGRPDIPIGTLKEKGFLDSSNYSKDLAERFPNDLKSGSKAPDAVTLFKELLAKQPDKSVTIVSVGPLRNARNLIASPGGKALVAQKVKEWSVMGGNYPNNPEAEWNFQQDGEASREAVENWPTPIMFSGGEVGAGMTTGTRLFGETDEKNPVRRAYQIYSGDGGRLSWDLTSVLYAARGLGPHFEAVKDGYNEVSANGSNRWRSSPNRGHAYLKVKMPKKLLGWEIDELVVNSQKNLYPKSAALPKTGWKASSNANNGRAAAGIDGDFDSEWGTGRPMAVGDFFAVDMGKMQAINRIELDSHWTGSDYPRGYELYVSNDGNTWGKPIKAGRGAAITLIAFDTITTRHFKIVQTGTLSREYQNTDRPWGFRDVSAFLEP